MVTASHKARRSLWLAVAFFSAFFLYSARVSAQSLTTGAIAGTVTDQSGAVVPNATVTVTSIAMGAMRTVITSAAGSYEVTLLLPGDYRIKVSAKGFKTADQGPITVTISHTPHVDIALEVGSTTQMVEVTANAQLIETENPNTTATVNNQALATLPNPGNDLSYVAQVAPGAIMNTSGGYGNMEFNGLPATSTNFAIDGMDANDPFLNLNNSGATNLQLGLNSMEEASVNTLSYSVDQGRQGAAQVNFVSKSGTNHIHGNIFETWNGSVMNGVDWFINAEPGAPAHRSRSNVNQFGGSIGGPVMHDKLFYFFDIEGIRIVVPTTKTEVYPTQEFDAFALTQIPLGGYDPRTNTTYAPPPNPSAATTYYQHALGLYGNPAGGIPDPLSDCPLGIDAVTGLPATPLAPPVYPAKPHTPHGNGCALRRVFGISNQTHDLYWKTRIDQQSGTANKVWYLFDWEKGVQATYTDPVNSAFNAYSTQPQNGAAIGWTHVFSPTLVNDFNPGYYWYSAIFEPTNFPAARAASPFEFTGGGFTAIYGDARDWPQGRNVTNWQILDNLTWTRGTHTLKFGENLRRTLVSDHDPGFYSTGYVNTGDLAGYMYDVAGAYSGTYGMQGFPTSTSEPIGLVAFDAYFMDTWKVKPKLTFTYGIRATWNADPLSQHSNFSEFSNGASFYDITHDVNQPLNSVINPHNSLLAFSTPRIDWQPRGAIAWEALPNTVIRVGGGIFSDVFPASVADGSLENTPNDNIFFASAEAGGQPILAKYAVPGSGDGVAGSPNNDVLTAIASAQSATLVGFKAGMLSCYTPNAAPPPNCLQPSGFTAVPKGEYKYPYFGEWSFSVEHQFRNNWAAKVAYVGTRAVDLPYDIQANGFQVQCPGCFTPYLYDPTYSGPDGRFGTVTQFTYGANSIYHALQASLQKRMSHGLTFNLNYTYSHCIDTLSNEGSLTGGFDPATSVTTVSPGELYLNRGNCDYDIRNALNGSYIYQLPSPIRGNAILKGIFNGWQVSGDLFLHSGYPFSVLSIAPAVYDGSDPNYAVPTGVSPYAKYQKLSTQTPGYPELQWLNPMAFQSVIDPDTSACTLGELNGAGDNASTCQYAKGGRNNVFGPPFKWTDMFVSKNFKIREGMNLRVDVQFYNLFNHANYALPGTTAGVPSIPDTLLDAFTVTGTANPPTGLLGSGLGGDNSVRMIALSARITF